MKNILHDIQLAISIKFLLDWYQMKGDALLNSLG